MDMSKIRERLIGAGATITIAGGLFWAVATANAAGGNEPEPEPTVTVEPTPEPVREIPPPPAAPATPEPVPDASPTPASPGAATIPTTPAPEDSVPETAPTEAEAPPEEPTVPLPADCSTVVCVNGVPTDPNAVDGDLPPLADGWSDENGVWHPAP